MMSSEDGRRRLRVFAFAIAAGFLLLGLTSWWMGREDLREGSRALADDLPRLETGSIPDDYHAVYRVEDRSGAEVTITTEKIWVRRPFDSRVEAWSGPPPGGQRLSVRQSNFGVLANRGRQAEPINLASPPSIASGDLRIDAVLDEAVADDTIAVRERREVFGRECQVYRTGGPVFAGDLTPYRDDATFGDVCVDERGIILEEVWVSNERLIRRRVATEVEVDPQLTPDLFLIDVPAEEGPFRGTVQRLAEGAPDEGLWSLSEPPDGFTELGRYIVIFPEGAMGEMSSLSGGSPPASTSQVYVRGSEIVVVDQDPSLAQLTGGENRASRPLELTGFVDAAVILDARMSEVRGQDLFGSIVRVYGTLPPSELVELARGLRLATG